ncbi:MAG: 2-oxoacid:acceptor oxidoreductase family protein [Mogibacterium sp.]|nr:2-oxoacid:acceptor oxidoreductase family protein [Mogibacterium sp.]
MEKTIIFTGIGGQGVKLAGEILCYAAVHENLNTTNYALYGREKRGGMSDCYVAISDETITEPVFSLADYVVAFTTETPASPAGKLRENSVLFMSTPNDVTAEDYNAKHFVKFDAAALAVEVGNPKGENMVILGVLVGYTDILPADVVEQTIFKKLGARHPEFNELNKKAFDKGLEVGRSYK